MAATIVETAPLVLNVGVVLLAAATMGFIARNLAYLQSLDTFLLVCLSHPLRPALSPITIS